VGYLLDEVYKIWIGCVFSRERQGNDSLGDVSSTTDGVEGSECAVKDTVSLAVQHRAVGAACYSGTLVRVEVT